MGARSDRCRRGLAHRRGLPAPRGGGGGQEPDGNTRQGTARHLAVAATELAAGRDLLRTHLVTDPAGLARGRSEWAPVVTSLPVLGALANEIGRWSRQLAPLAALLAGPAPRHGARHGDGRDISEMTARSEFASASGWLQAAGAAVRTALDIDPVRTSDTELLYAVPAAMTPQRQRLGPNGESAAELCDGIAVSASRLRSAMRDNTKRARWSPTSPPAGGSGWPRRQR